jgi:hypothetical protein
MYHLAWKNLRFAITVFIFQQLSLSHSISAFACDLTDEPVRTSFISIREEGTDALSHVFLPLGPCRHPIGSQDRSLIEAGMMELK